MYENVLDRRRWNEPSRRSREVRGRRTGRLDAKSPQHEQRFFCKPEHSVSSPLSHQRLLLHSREPDRPTSISPPHNRPQARQPAHAQRPPVHALRRPSHEHAHLIRQEPPLPPVLMAVAQREEAAPLGPKEGEDEDAETEAHGMREVQQRLLGQRVGDWAGRDGEQDGRWSRAGDAELWGRVVGEEDH